MQQVRYVKTCISLKRNLRIEWKFGHYKLILNLSTEKCHQNSISKSQNGPLTGCVWITDLLQMKV